MKTLTNKRQSLSQWISQNKNTQLLLVLLILATGYTFCRYIVFGTIAPIHLPSYLLNKTVSLLSVMTLAVTAYYYQRNDINSVKHWGTVSLHFVFLHILLSLILISSAYYPKFFGEAKLNLKGELIMFFGAIASYCYWRLGKPESSFNRHRLHLLQVLAALFVGAHLLVMGYSGWLTPSKWHGGMPPISLVSFSLSLYALYGFQTSTKPATADT